MSIIRTHSKGWEAVPRAPFEDRRLSLVTRGVLGWLLTRPENWEIRVSSMLRLLPMSEFIWQKTVSPELQSAGYLTVSRSREGGRWVWDYSVVSVPPDNIEMESKHAIPKKFRHGDAARDCPLDKRNKSSKLIDTHNHHGCAFLGDLPPELRDSFLRIAHDLPLEKQQDIADELAGQILAGKVRNPKGLLVKLDAAVRSGNLSLDNARSLRRSREAALRSELAKAKFNKIELDPEACAKGIGFLGPETQKRLVGGLAS